MESGNYDEMGETEMKEEIRSTVIIPNYNGIRFLEACLDSLKEEPAHILLVDNGSTDGSTDFVRTQYPEVELLSLEKNYGFCGAVNRGIEHSKTTYVILLNNDTQVQSGFVRALEHALDRDERVFSGSAQMRNLQKPEWIDDTGDYYCALGWAFTLGKDKSIENYQQARTIFAACGGASVFRRSLLKETGLLDENHFAYLEDIDLGYRARIAGYRNVYVPEAVVFHAGSGTTGTRHNKFKVDLSSRNNVYLVYKNMPWFQILLNLPFLLLGYLVKTLFFARKGLAGAYVKGLGKGIRLSLSEKGRANKVTFRWRNLPHYGRIQLELWRNLLYRIRA